MASPGGGAALNFHWAQRDEFVNDPSFSAKSPAGRRKISVFGFSFDTFQNSAVSVGKHSAMTHQSSLPSAAMTFSVFGPFPTGFIPKSRSPWIWPWYMWSKR